MESAWIEVYAKQEQQQNPYNLHLEGGLAVPKSNIVGAFNLSQSTDNAKELTGHLLLKWNDKSINTQFTVSESGNFRGYVFTSTTKFPDEKTVQLRGTLKFETGIKMTNIDLTFQGHEVGSGIPHQGRIVFRNSEMEKLIIFELKGRQDFLADINFNKEDHYYKINLQWDKTTSDVKQVLVEVNTKEDFSVDVRILNFSSKLRISNAEKSCKFVIGIDEKTMELDTRLKVSFDDLDILFLFQSSFLSLSNLRGQISFSQKSINSSQKLDILVRN